MNPKALEQITASHARLERAAFLACGDEDLRDEVQDALAYTIQELAEAYGVDERGVEAIRAILVNTEARAVDYEQAHRTPAIVTERPS